MELTETEAAIYDRQLRVWGVETQRRLTNSKVLVVGCTGLAAEVAKNIVLAGVGGVTLVDDTPCSRCPPANFLIPAAADPDTTVAQACVAALQEMNPFVKVAAASGPAEALFTAEALRHHNLLLLCGQPAHVVAAADTAAAEAGVAFYAATCRGIAGWAFANLHEHAYVVEKEVEQPDGTTAKQVEKKAASYTPWAQALAGSLAGGKKLRRTSKLYLVLRVIARFEQQARRHPTADDVPALLELRRAVAADADVDAAAVDERLLAAYALQAEEMPAINAIVGGVLANEVLKAVSQKGDPICNWFLFSLIDGAGMVERTGGATGGAE